MDWLEWYHTLAKPAWTPAPATIGLIWRILYPIILISFGYVFVQAYRRKLPPPTALPFALNLTANLLFTPIQFGLRSLTLAALDILVVWITILWCMHSVRRTAPWVALAQVPYFVWAGIATVLQLSIVAMNS